MHKLSCPELRTPDGSPKCGRVCFTFPRNSPFPSCPFKSSSATDARFRSPSRLGIRGAALGQLGLGVWRLETQGWFALPQSGWPSACVVCLKGPPVGLDRFVGLRLDCFCLRYLNAWFTVAPVRGLNAVRRRACVSRSGCTSLANFSCQLFRCYLTWQLLPPNLCDCAYQLFLPTFKCYFTCQLLLPTFGVALHPPTSPEKIGVTSRDNFISTCPANFSGVTSPP